MAITKIGWVDLMVTERCNLNCIYCFHKQMPKDMSFETLDNMMEFLDPIFEKQGVFNFFGGEPLLRPDFVLEACKKLKAKFPNWKFHISTNCSVEPLRIKEFIDNYVDSIQLSYDGLDQPTTRGIPELAEENIRKYVEYVRNDRLNVRLTYTKETVGNLYNNLVHIYKLGIRRVMHSPDFCPGWTQEHYDEYVRQLDKIYDFVKEHPDYKVKFADCLNAIEDKPSSKCGMGAQLITVSADGGIYPCHRSVSLPEFRIGDVNKGELNRGLFLKLECHKCSKCEVHSICHHCMVADYIYLGSLTIPQECDCAINKIELEKAAKAYTDLYGSCEGWEHRLSKMVNVFEDIRKDSQLLKEMIKRSI